MSVRQVFASNAKPNSVGGGSRWAFVVLAGCVSFAALAQNPSVDDELIRQQDRERRLRSQQEVEASVRLIQPPPAQDARLLPGTESPCFLIDRIALNEGGNEQPSENFAWAIGAADRADDGSLDPALGRCLGVAGINTVMHRIQNAVIQRGYVTTRILAGSQDLNQKRLTLTVVPGRIRAIRFASDADERATQWNAMPAKPGDLLNVRDLEQALENFKHVPTADANMRILPATGPDANPGDSVIEIGWQQARPIRISASVDDAGTRDTGKYQGSLTFALDHPLTLNDQFYASINQDLGGRAPGDRGTNGRAVHYSLPFGLWMLGLSSSRNRFRQSVAGGQETYVYSGSSLNSEVRASRVIHRDAVRKITVSAAGWLRSSSNYVNDVEIILQRRRTAGWELGVQTREYIDRSILNASLAVRRGTGAWNAQPAAESSAGQGDSRASIVTAELGLNVPFSLRGEQARYSVNLRSQWTPHVLPPQDRFTLGTRSTVRGFDGENLLTAEHGLVVRNEFGLALGTSGQEAYLGLDYGELGGPSSADLAGRSLMGAALGLRGALGSLSYEVFVATPLKKPDNFKTSGVVSGFSLFISL